MTVRGRGRKTLYDCYGFPIVNIRRKRNSLFGEYEVPPPLSPPPQSRPPTRGNIVFPQVFEGEGSSQLLLTISGKWSWGGSKMIVSMMNWNKECVQLRVRGSLMGRHCKIVFDDIEVGRILANLPKNTNSAGKESYTISAAAYGT